MSDFAEITSKSNPLVVRVASLQEKKYREKYREFFTEGVKLALEALQRSLPVSFFMLEKNKAQEWLPHLSRAAAESGQKMPPVYLLSEACFQKISTEKSPQGVITVIKYLDFFQRCIKIEGEQDDFGRTVCLCSLRDPGNLGAVIRSAAAFGAQTLLLSQDCADLYHPKTLRAAMGNLFCMRALTVTDLPSSILALRQMGRRVYAAELREGSRPLSDISLTGSDIFVIGNEGHGIAKEVADASDGSVYLPITPGVESLNAAVAASVLLWEQSKTL